MKVKKLLTAALILGLLFCLAAPGQADAWYYSCGGCSGCWSGWETFAAVAGGMVVGAVVGNLLVQAMQPPRQAAPAYAYPAPPVSAAPSPPAYGNEWVTVPGQSVNGVWVPPHQVLVPVRR